MNVYVETNFILELAWMQEQYESCENILTLCEAGKAKLILPAYSIGETFEKLGRHKQVRKQLSDDFTKQLKELKRSSFHKDRIRTFDMDMVAFFLQNTELENEKLLNTHDRLFSVAEIIAMEKDILISAIKSPAKLESPQDSIVYASVLKHLYLNNTEKSCFLNKNTKDFNDPAIKEELRNNKCKLFLGAECCFNDGYSYINSCINKNFPQ
jgi:predicted nucleic acid-binding protein